MQGPITQVHGQSLFLHLQPGRVAGAASNTSSWTRHLHLVKHVSGADRHTPPASTTTTSTETSPSNLHARTESFSFNPTHTVQLRVCVRHRHAYAHLSSQQILYSASSIPPLIILDPFYRRACTIPVSPRVADRLVVSRPRSPAETTTTHRKAATTLATITAHHG